MGIIKKLLVVFILLLNQLVFAQDSLKLNISVMLPFCAKDILLNTSAQNKPISDASREYYQGMLIAMDSIAVCSNNMDITIKVFDTKKDTLTIKSLLQDKFIKESNLIVGPALKEGHILLHNFCKQNKIYHLSPFLTLTKSSINDPYLISYNPDLNSYADFLIKHLTNSGLLNINLIIVKGSAKYSNLLIKRFKELELLNKHIKFNYIDVADDKKNFNAYKTGGSNFSFILSEDESQVNAMIKHYTDSNFYADITVFGLKKWLDFKSVSADLWQKANVTIITPFYADNNLQEVINFNQKYINRFYTEPTEFAYEGYRQTIFIKEAYFKSKGNFADMAKAGNVKILGLNNFFDGTLKNNSIYNLKLNLIKFVDYRLKIIN